VPRPNTPLFREEALRHHLLRREFGDVLRLPPAWTRWTYPWIVTMVLTALALAALVQVPRYVQGSATLHLADDGAAWLEARLPAAELSRPLVGEHLRVSFPAFPRRSLRARIETAAARPSLDTTLTPQLPQPVILLRARLLAPVSDEGALALADGLPARVELLLGRERLLFLLLPSLRR
jgi:hypothetical protein